MYKLQIYRFEPRSEEDKKQIEDSRRWGKDYPFTGSYPDGVGRDDYKTVRMLDVEISDEEWNRIKTAVLREV